MKIIGLTGPTGTGKSTVSLVAASMGIEVIDCDKAARNITKKGAPVLQKLSLAFGADIIGTNGELDRKLLAERAFLTQTNTEKLNSIVLPVVVEDIKKRLNEFLALGVKTVLLDAPTLFESGIDSVCDEVIAVLCPENVRRSRIIERDNLTEQQAETRLRASKPDSFYKERTQHIIYSDVGFDEFSNAAKELLIRLAV